MEHWDYAQTDDRYAFCLIASLWKHFVVSVGASIEDLRLNTRAEAEMWFPTRIGHNPQTDSQLWSISKKAQNFKNIK